MKRVGSSNDSSESEERRLIDENLVVRSPRFATPVIEYVIQNPKSPEVYRKLVETFPEVFNLNPLRPAAFLNGSKLCLDETCHRPPIFCNGTVIDVHTEQAKIWITHGITLVPIPHRDGTITDTVAQDLPAVCRKLYKRDIPRIRIFSNETIGFGDFAYVAAAATTLYLDVQMAHDDGNGVKLEEILTALDRVEHVKIDCKDGYIQKGTAKKMYDAANLDSLQSIILNNVSSDMDLHYLLKFVMKHKNVMQSYRIIGQITDYYRFRLGEVVAAVFAEPNLKCRIRYDGQDRAEIVAMTRRILS